MTNAEIAFWLGVARDVFLVLLVAAQFAFHVMTLRRLRDLERAGSSSPDGGAER